MATPAQKRLIEKRLTDIRQAKNTPWSQKFKWTGFSGKTLWDWLNLLAALLIPIVVLGATIGFGQWQTHLADVQHQQDQTNALDQQRATILQTYIDNIQDLLLNHRLLISKPTDDVAILARARTLTALQSLDPTRKGSLVQFIYEAQLIGFSDSASQLHNGIIDLSGANLNGAHLSFIGLRSADLSGADFNGADFNGADLEYTVFLGADLNGADLSFAHLGDADLNGAHLNNAHLRFANLRGTHFSGADLSFADLSDADLDDTNLDDTNLSSAHLSKAWNLTQQQLNRVSTCKGATLPQGLTCQQNW